MSKKSSISVLTMNKKDYDRMRAGRIIHYHSEDLLVLENSITEKEFGCSPVDGGPIKLILKEERSEDLFNI